MPQHLVLPTSSSSAAPTERCLLISLVYGESLWRRRTLSLFLKSVARLPATVAVVGDPPPPAGIVLPAPVFHVRLPWPELAAKLVDEAQRRGEPCALAHKLLVSLFDADRPSFFGRTWEGPEADIHSRQLRSSSLDVEPDIDLFVHTRLYGPRCRAIVENCFVLRHDGRTTEHAAGWALIAPFERPDILRDLQDDRHVPQHQQRNAQYPGQQQQQQQQQQQAPLRWNPWPTSQQQQPPRQQQQQRR